MTAGNYKLPTSCPFCENVWVESFHCSCLKTSTWFKFNNVSMFQSSVWTHLHKKQQKTVLTNGVLSPCLLQKVILTVFLCPVRWSKVWQVSNGGLYRCRLTAHSVWLTFSTRCRPMESETDTKEENYGTTVCRNADVRQFRPNITLASVL